MNSKDQNKALFIRAYEDYSDAIFRFTLLKTRNRDLALDITQETFTKTWEYIEADKEIGHMRGFLYQIARNLIIDQHRKKTAYSLESLKESGFDPETDEREHADDFDIEKALSVLDELDPKYRDPITMRYIEDLSIKEIAKVLDEQENTVSVRIHRGLEKLRTLLPEEDVIV